MKEIIDYFKNYGVDANTTATIIITLFTFSVGLLITWISGQIKSYWERRLYRRILLFILENFSKSCDKQTKTVNKSLGNLGLKSGNDFIVNYIAIGTLDYLSELDLNIFLQNFKPYFQRKKFSKAVSSLFSLPAQIKLQHETALNVLEKLSKEFQIHFSNFYENVDNLRKLNDELSMDVSTRPITNEKESELLKGFF